jgi:hypothetical protein
MVRGREWSTLVSGSRGGWLLLLEGEGTGHGGRKWGNVVLGCERGCSSLSWVWGRQGRLGVRLVVVR